MFLHANPNPTPAKHVIYLISTTVMGVLLSFLTHAGIETLYLQWAEQTGHVVTWYSGCALHPFIQVGLVLAGAVGGFFLGKMWWRMVYIDRVWAKGKFSGQQDH